MNATIPCIRAADQDVLGLGVRLGAYLQACSLLLHMAWQLDAKTTADAALLTSAALFTMAICRYKVQDISDFGLVASMSLFTFQISVHQLYITHRGPPELVVGLQNILFQGGKPDTLTLRRFIVHYILLAVLYTLELFLVVSGDLHRLHNAACATAYSAMHGNLQGLRYRVMRAISCILELLFFAYLLQQSVRRMRAMARSPDCGGSEEGPDLGQDSASTRSVTAPCVIALQDAPCQPYEAPVALDMSMLFRPSLFPTLRWYRFHIRTVVYRIVTRIVAALLKRSVRIGLVVALLLKTLLDTELLLHWNQVTGAGEINSTGQLISLFIGIVTLAQGVFSILQQQYRKRNSDDKVGVELATGNGDDDSGGHKGSGSAADANGDDTMIVDDGFALNDTVLGSRAQSDQPQIEQRMPSKRLIRYNTTPPCGRNAPSRELSRVLTVP
jgi:hypothetical protein